MVSAAAPPVDEAARHQTVFREVNENIAKLTDLVTETGYCLFVCECSDVNCAESLEITAPEYEAVREHGARFLVAPGHQLDAIEQVVNGNGRFLVVEKLGQAGEIANAANPRTA